MKAIDSVDISGLVTNEDDKDNLVKISEKLAASLKTTGFVYLTNHGVGEEVIKEALTASAEYFKLDEAVKARDAVGHGPEFQGWVARGREVFDQAEVRSILKRSCL